MKEKDVTEITAEGFVVERKAVAAVIKPKISLSSYLKRSWILYVMLLLPLLFFAVFRYIPMTNIVIAFKNYNLNDGIWAKGSSFLCDRETTGVHVINCDKLISGYQVECEGSISGEHIPSCPQNPSNASYYLPEERICGWQDYCQGLLTGVHLPGCNDQFCGFERYCHPGITGGHIEGCSHWVGLEWFKNAFGRRDFWLAMRNTLMLNILDLIVGFPAPIILALILNELIFRRFKKITQTVIYLPHFLSWIIVSSIATRLLAPTNGVLNLFIVENFGTKPIDFLMNSKNWVATYITFGVWKEMGWGTIIYLAAITGINPELYEAAEVDGAGRWRKLWNVTLPGIRATIVVLLIMNIGRILGIEFDRPYTMANRVVMDVADVLSTLVYRVGIRSFQFSLTAAIGLFQSIICVVFLVAANSLAKRFGERGIW